jgi:hypothetical protein
MRDYGDKSVTLVHGGKRRAKKERRTAREEKVRTKRRKWKERQVEGGGEQMELRENSGKENKRKRLVTSNLRSGSRGRVDSGNDRFPCLRFVRCS